MSEGLWERINAMTTAERQEELRRVRDQKMDLESYEFVLRNILLLQDLYIKIEPDALDGGFVSSHPFWPGVLAQGETEVEARANWWVAFAEVEPTEESSS